MTDARERLKAALDEFSEDGILVGTFSGSKRIFDLIEATRAVLTEQDVDALKVQMAEILLAEPPPVAGPWVTDGSNPSEYGCYLCLRSFDDDEEIEPQHWYTDTQEWGLFDPVAWTGPIRRPVKP